MTEPSRKLPTVFVMVEGGLVQRKPGTNHLDYATTVRVDARQVEYSPGPGRCRECKSFRPNWHIVNNRCFHDDGLRHPPPDGSGYCHNLEGKK